MSDATGAGSPRAVTPTPEEELHALSGQPDDDARGMSAAPNDDIRGMSYETARDELVAVVDRLERGGTTLEQSLALWERGEALAARCESWLVGARARLDAARAAAQPRG